MSLAPRLDNGEEVNQDTVREEGIEGKQRGLRVPQGGCMPEVAG